MLFRSFGKETTAITPSNISSSAPSVPLATVIDAGTLTNSANGASFTNGIGAKTYNWSEVGIFDLTTTLTNYLAAGDNIIGAAQNIGRFTPHHFETLVTHACNSFTYSGQPFTVTALARNKANATTVNYRGTFAKGVTLTDANPPATPLGNFLNNTLDSASFSVSPDFGQSTVTDLTYTFLTKETAPEIIEIRATDITDTTISSDTFAEGSTEIRSGRMRLENAFGPELTPLTLPLKVENYSDNATPADLTDDGFILNTDDSCTTYDATAGTLSNFTGNLDLADVAVTGADTVALGIGSVIIHQPGDITLGPGAGNEGSVNLLLGNTLSWLTFNWGIDCDGDTVNDTGACATASFGLYRGDDRIIYWREVF